MTIGSCSKGEICEGEESTALHTPACIEVVSLNCHLCTSITFMDIDQLDTIRASELIMKKE